MKAVKEHLSKTNPDRVPVFEKNAQGMAKKILGNFKDYEFYTGEGMNPDGALVAAPASPSLPELTDCSLRRYGCPPQLPRGRCDALLHLLEGRPQGGQALNGSLPSITSNLSFLFGDARVDSVISSSFCCG